MTSFATLLTAPETAIGGLNDGSLRRVGAVIRWAKGPQKGKIFAYLQETGALERTVKTVGKSLSKGGTATAATGNPAIGAVTVASDLLLQATQAVQGEVIRRGVKRIEVGVNRLEESMGRVEFKLDGLGKGVQTLQQLGVANLAIGAAGLGVSLVGLGIMNAKLNRVQESIQAFADRLDTISDKIDRVRQDMIDQDFLKIHSLVQLYEEAWSHSDRGRAELQWHGVAQEARTYQDRFLHRARELLTADPPDIALADPMIDALTLTGSLRVSALMACNESASARLVADEASWQVESLTGIIGLADLVPLSLPENVEPGSQDWDLAFTAATELARPMVHKMREREAAVATRAAPLNVLESRGIAPREWLEAARSESEQPVLLLSDQRG